MKHKQTQTKTILLALAIMLAAPALILCQTSSKNGAEQEVRKTVDDLAAALRNNDTAALDRIYADDYTFVGDTGTIMTKAERIAAFKAGDVKYESVNIEVARIRFFGDTAVVITHITTKLKPGGKFNDGKFINTSTFIKIKGRWQLAAAGNTRLSE
jgi:uncharacterized protein (TIGR02246 family)